MCLAIHKAPEWYILSSSPAYQNAIYDVHAAIADPDAVLQYVPLDRNIATSMMDIPRRDMPDLPDRIIAASFSIYCVPFSS